MGVLSVNRKHIIVLIFISLLLILTNVFTLKELYKLRSNANIAGKSTENIIDEDYSDNSSKETYIIIYKTDNLGRPTKGWEDYFESYPNQDKGYLGKSINEIKELFGEPYITIKSIDSTRVFWCYMPNAIGEDLEYIDNTGIKWYFEDDKVVKVVIDDFNGIIEEQAEIYIKW